MLSSNRFSLVRSVFLRIFSFCFVATNELNMWSCEVKNAKLKTQMVTMKITEKTTTAAANNNNKNKKKYEKNVRALHSFAIQN